eukprot:3047473-Rhodomonas_salina.2
MQDEDFTRRKQRWRAAETTEQLQRARAQPCRSPVDAHACEIPGSKMALGADELFGCASLMLVLRRGPVHCATLAVRSH